MNTKIIIILITGVVALSAFTVFAGDPVPGLDITIKQIPGGTISSKNYKSSLSDKSIAQVMEGAGNTLLDYGVGGEDINKVTDALEGNGVYEAELKSFLIAIGINKSDVQTILIEFDKLGIAINEEGLQAISTPATEVEEKTAKEEDALIGSRDTLQSAPVLKTDGQCKVGTICVKGMCIPDGKESEVSTPRVDDDTFEENDTKSVEESFRVEMDNVQAGFKSISGMDSETEVIEFKQGDDMVVRKKPGRTTYSNIVLKRGFVSSPSLIEEDRVIFHDAAKSAIWDMKSIAPEEREKLIGELRISRQIFRENIQTLRQNTRDNAKELREKFRENVRTVIGHVDHGKTAHIAIAHGRGIKILNRYRSAMARFEHILGRIGSRVEKLEARGVDMSLVIPIIEEAENIRVKNDAKMEELKAKYEELLSGENPRGIGEEARGVATELKSEIQTLHAKLREIVDEIKQATKDYNSSISNSSSELKITLIQNTIEKIQERLKRCDNIDVCDIVERHAEGREGLIDITKKVIENRNREEAARLLREVRGIVVGDIELLESVESIESIADVLELERSLLNYVDSALISI